MTYRIAGIDVHKKRLAVVIADIAAEGGSLFERRRFGSGPQELRTLAGWLVEQQVEEVVMESTAQYWKPVWASLQRYWQPMCGQPATELNAVYRRLLEMVLEELAMIERQIAQIEQVSGVNYSFRSH